MTSNIEHIDKAEKAFSGQAPVFDLIYGNDSIIRYKRKRVREHFLQHLKQGDHILELNCGTGEDAIFFAQKGFRIHATDVSSGMLETAAAKVELARYTDRISFQQLSFTDLNQLNERYDAVFSDFGGLNCTDKLNEVLASFDHILKPGGVVCLVIISKFCIWETLLALKGRFKTAFRRFFSTKGRTAKIFDQYFTCWYYSPKKVIEQLSPKFTLLNLEALCVAVPPSYIEVFAEKHPRIFQRLVNIEEKIKAKKPWRSCGDYFIISMQKL